MKLKLAVASAIAALAMPMAPALAADGIPGTCFVTRIGGGGGTTTHECECLVGPPIPTVVSTNPLIIEIRYCVVNI